jgi:hypothetical protein
VERFAARYGAVNEAVSVKGVTFARVNSMVLDGARDESLRADTDK